MKLDYLLSITLILYKTEIKSHTVKNQNDFNDLYNKWRMLQNFKPMEVDTFCRCKLYQNLALSSIHWSIILKFYL